jgi:hypothetical protein
MNECDPPNAICTNIQWMNVILSVLYAPISREQPQSPRDKCGLPSNLCTTHQGIDLISLNAMDPQITKVWTYPPAICITLSLKGNNLNL